ncbi:uncharacterized protein LOC130703802 [Daphnia carinata]|uniref:uncharacterized protein LOC130703802 n=1 Tax=Daphnia carinata TaxID=120202 RepID=UPI00257DDBDC|nr:uncharacterized protein LOC130703802 [Daphnia carinata]
MSTTRQHPFLNIFCLKVVIILMAHQIFQNFAFGDIFVMNASMIESDCVSSCGTSQVDYDFNFDCQRGCRFFETYRTASILVQFDDMAALKTCHQSCLEAYGNEPRKIMACSNGCTSAQHAYRKVYSLSLQWLQELHKNVTFFETLMDVTDAVVNSRRFVDVPIRFQSTNQNTKSLPVKEEFFPVRTQRTLEKQADLPEENYDVKKPSSMVPDWIAQSAFVFFTLGIVLLLGVCCYCCIFAHFFRHMREKNIMDTELPPSYEELIRNSYVIMSPSRINHYHPTRVNKREELCSIDIDETAEDTEAEATFISNGYCENLQG